MNDLATSINEILLMMSLCSFNTDKTWYLFWPMIDRSHVLTLFWKRKEQSGVADVASLVKIIWMIFQTFFINGHCYLSSCWRVLQIPRKLSGANCLEMVGRISSWLCKFCVLKCHEQSNFKNFTLSDTSVFFIVFNISSSILVNLFKAGFSNLFFIVLLNALRASK